MEQKEIENKSSIKNKRFKSKNSNMNKKTECFLNNQTNFQISRIFIKFEEKKFTSYLIQFLFQKFFLTFFYTTNKEKTNKKAPLLVECANRLMTLILRFIHAYSAAALIFRLYQLHSSLIYYISICLSVSSSAMVVVAIHWAKEGHETWLLWSNM